MYELFNILDRNGIVAPQDLLKAATLPAKKIEKLHYDLLNLSPTHGMANRRACRSPFPFGTWMFESAGFRRTGIANKPGKCAQEDRPPSPPSRNMLFRNPGAS
jgi:hypothetical protein